MTDLLDIFDDELIDKQISNVTPDPPKKTKKELIEDLVIKYMDEYGITNNYMKAAMMGIILNEGGFSGTSENLYYTTPGRLAEVWSVFSNYTEDGKRKRAPEGEGSKYANELAKSGKYLKNPQALGNFIYANQKGNEPGTDDGYRYRGRGLNQLTGKGAYKSLGNALGVDLVNNPELLETDPDLQAKAAVYFLHKRLSKTLPRLTEKYPIYKKRFGNYVDYNNIDNIEDASFILTSANAGFGSYPKEKTFSDRLASAKKYETQFVENEERWQDEEFEVDPVELAQSVKDFKEKQTSSNRPAPQDPKIGNIENFKIDNPQINSNYDISPLPVNIPESVNTIPPKTGSETSFINSGVQNFSKEELEQQTNFLKLISDSVMRNSAIPRFGQGSVFGQGQLFGADKKRTGGSINIKPENKGKFTAKANAAGMGVQAFANKVLGASEGTYSPSTRRQELLKELILLVQEDKLILHVMLLNGIVMEVLYILDILITEDL
jgi:predicted chitinase